MTGRLALGNGRYRDDGCHRRPLHAGVSKAGARPRSCRRWGSLRCQPTTAALGKCVDNLAAGRSGPGSGSRWGRWRAFVRRRGETPASATDHCSSIANSAWSKQTSFGSPSHLPSWVGGFGASVFRSLHEHLRVRKVGRASRGTVGRTSGGRAGAPGVRAPRCGVRGRSSADDERPAMRVAGGGRGGAGGARVRGFRLGVLRT